MHSRIRRPLESSASAESGGQLQLILAVAPCLSARGPRRDSVLRGEGLGAVSSSPGDSKFTFVPSVDSYGAPFVSFGQAMLVDDWGQVIEYFPRYGPDE